MRGNNGVIEFNRHKTPRFIGMSVSFGKAAPEPAAGSSRMKVMFVMPLHGKSSCLGRDPASSVRISSLKYTSGCVREFFHPDEELFERVCCSVWREASRLPPPMKHGTISWAFFFKTRDSPSFLSSPCQVQHMVDSAVFWSRATHAKKDNF